MIARRRARCCIVQLREDCNERDVASGVEVHPHLEAKREISWDVAGFAAQTATTLFDILLLKT